MITALGVDSSTGRLEKINPADALSVAELLRCQLRDIESALTSDKYSKDKIEDALTILRTDLAGKLEFLTTQNSPTT